MAYSTDWYSTQASVHEVVNQDCLDTCVTCLTYTTCVEVMTYHSASVTKIIPRALDPRNMTIRILLNIG